MFEAYQGGNKVSGQLKSYKKLVSPAIYWLLNNWIGSKRIQRKVTQAPQLYHDGAWKHIPTSLGPSFCQ